MVVQNEKGFLCILSVVQHKYGYNMSPTAVATINHPKQYDGRTRPPNITSLPGIASSSATKGHVDCSTKGQTNIKHPASGAEKRSK